MLLLQSHDRYDDVLLLDCPSRVLVRGSKGESPELAHYPVRGHFTLCDGHLVMLYRLESKLHFVLDEQDVTLTSNTTVGLHRDEAEGTQVLHIVPECGKEVHWTCTLPRIDPPLELDPTPFVEREDFDSCLFVFNVANDSERRRRIYQLEEDLSDAV